MKRGPDGEIDRYKARFVAKGFTQCFGLDYNEAFSPVVRAESLRLIIALANNLNMDMDICTAFLNGDLEEVVYMEQSEGFVDDNNPDKVCLLKRAIYGLKQASRAWNEKLNSVLSSMGFERSKCDPCVYVKRSSKELLTIVAVHVDDILIISNDQGEKCKVKSRLSEKFESKDLGELKYFLGISVERDRKMGVIRLSQKSYLEKVLLKYNMSKCNPVATPLEKGLYLENNKGNKPSLPYQNLIGSLLYLSVWTRPDITQAVSYLSQFNQYFDYVHWTNAKRVLKYLQGAKDLCLTFTKGEKELIGFCDADWGSDPIDRKSFSGYIFNFCGGPISWQSRKQSAVAQSSTEAEYVALSQAGNEAVYLQRLIEELVNLRCVANLKCDNQGAIFLSSNPVFQRRTKHIDIAYHNVRNLVEKKVIVVKHVPSEQMVADVFTKPLGRLSFERCVRKCQWHNVNVCNGMFVEQ